MKSLLIAAALGVAAPIAPVVTEVEAPGPAGPLKGTMLTAVGGATPPIVLIIPGSGPTDRDGNNRLGVTAAPYRLLAEALAAQGVSSVRIDKRGLFGSKAAVTDVSLSSIGGYADDMQSWSAAIRKLTGAPCVWLLGHSEGGLVALAAAHRLGVCGLVLVSTAGRPLASVIREQLLANPANAPLLPDAMRAMDMLEAGKTFDASTYPAPLQPLFNKKVQPYLIDTMRYDPARLIAAAGKPILIVQGDHDIRYL